MEVALPYQRIIRMAINGNLYPAKTAANDLRHDIKREGSWGVKEEEGEGASNKETMYVYIDLIDGNIFANVSPTTSPVTARRRSKAETT